MSLGAAGREKCQEKWDQGTIRPLCSFQPSLSDSDPSQATVSFLCPAWLSSQMVMTFPSSAQASCEQAPSRMGLTGPAPGPKAALFQQVTTF